MALLSGAVIGHAVLLLWLWPAPVPEYLAPDVLISTYAVPRPAWTEYVAAIVGSLLVAAGLITHRQVLGSDDVT